MTTNLFAFSFLLFTMTFGSICQGQIKHITYRAVDSTAFQSIHQSSESKSTYYRSALNYALRESKRIYIQERNRSRTLTQTAHKIKIIQQTYEKAASLPDSIENGWHNVVLTDNIEICNDVKVYVQDNKIKNMVIENYLPLNFLPIGKINEGKATVTITDTDGSQLDILEACFIYDLDETNLTSPPNQPGFVCFWTDWKKFDSIKIQFDGYKLDYFTQKFDTQPSCFQKGTVCIMKKPGTYPLKALGRGSIDWIDQIEIKSGMCTTYLLGK